MRTAITLALVAATLAGLATTAGARARRRSPAPWTVTVETSGGFTGRGRGSVAVDANGIVRATLAGPPNATPQRRTVRLTSVEREAIAAAVVGATPTEWSGKTFGNAAADAMTYRLTLRRGAQAWTATWYDSSRDELPPRVAALFDAIEPAWSRAEASAR